MDAEDKARTLSEADDVLVAIGHGEMRLQRGDLLIELNIRHIFRDGPVSWRDLRERYLLPALYQLRKP